MTPATPSDVLRALVDGVPAQRWDELPGLYAPNAVVDQPYARPEPVHLSGRDAVAEHFRRVAQFPLRLRADNVVIHTTTDPEVVIGEFDYHGLNPLTGATVVVANVICARVRDGLIVESRDYHDHVALGRLARS